MVLFGQLVVGPPGSGKTTFCDGMKQMFTALGRKNVIVNLDPANDVLPYECGIDVNELTSVEHVMTKHNLGPNGALVFCMEYIVVNFDWLEEALARYKECYVVFDCPGQVELYTHYQAMHQLISLLNKSFDFRLTAVHLTDSTFCSDPQKYISALLVCLGTQIQLELPHVNVLTKLDILRHSASDLDFRIEYYAEAADLSQLIRTLSEDKTHRFDRRFSDFNEALCELVEDFNLISFQLLDIQDKESVLAVLKIIDTANGYSLGSVDSSIIPFNVVLPHAGTAAECFGSIQENYIDIDDDE